ncbi:hypothetical protein JIN85_17375 [Luteolibacter pohnpeiensis]|uniref:Lipoprotein n=1 Tax=Luteolibacter pohnpeiensis TaxID=454153 RepID=A0A934VY54_9BACT|nr:hypothetical protein [Luteolibacter pohnpeiensis]MBK1884194.1 hypothetical protein [Luteolibacter pohnpeiensis]
MKRALSIGLFRKYVRTLSARGLQAGAISLIALSCSEKHQSNEKAGADKSKDSNHELRVGHSSAERLTTETDRTPHLPETKEEQSDESEWHRMSGELSNSSEEWKFVLGRLESQEQWIMASSRLRAYFLEMKFNSNSEEGKNLIKIEEYLTAATVEDIDKGSFKERYPSLSSLSREKLQVILGNWATSAALSDKFQKIVSDQVFEETNHLSPVEGYSELLSRTHPFVDSYISDAIANVLDIVELESYIRIHGTESQIKAREKYSKLFFDRAKAKAESEEVN